MNKANIKVACAGWSLPRASWPRFPPEGTHLERYAHGLPAVEINSSFYRPHEKTTYVRWAQGTPPDFRFAVKLPKSISHMQRLSGGEDLLRTFLDQISGLGKRLGCILVQLPPSLRLDAQIAASFFALLRRHYQGPLALEPRHASWAGPEAEALMRDHRIARVMADPVRIPGGERPSGWSGLVYLRLHGSPRVYASAYDSAYLQRLARELREYQQGGADVWCIFDNTMHGAATLNALELRDLLGQDADTDDPAG